MSDEAEHLREHAVLLGDLVKLFHLKKKVLLKTCLYAGVVCSLFSLLMPIKYQIKAAFKDGENSNAISSNSNALSMLLQGPKAKNSFAALMKTRFLLHQVIAESGIQVSEEMMPLVFRVIKRVRRNLSSQYNEKIAWAETVSFRNVLHSGKNKSSFLLKGIDKSSYIIRDNQGKEFQGIVGKPIQFNETTLTVASIPQDIMGKWKRHYIQPHDRLLENLQKALSILPNKLDNSIIEIKMEDGIPSRSIAIVNAVMKIYKAYLTAESGRITNEHLESLYEHKKYVQDRVADDFKKYAESMKRSVDAVGFLDPRAEIEYLYKEEKKLVESAYHLEQLLMALYKGYPSFFPELTYRRKLLQEEEEILTAQSMLDIEMLNKGNVISNRPSMLRDMKDPLLRNYLHDKIHMRLPFLHESHIDQIMHRILSATAVHTYLDKNTSQNFDGMDFRIFDENLLKNYSLTLLKDLQNLQLLRESMLLAKNKLRDTLYDVKSLKIFAQELDLPSVINFDELLMRSEDISHFTEKERRQTEHQVQVAKEMLSKTLEEKIAFLKQKEYSLRGSIYTVQNALRTQLDKKLLNLQSYRSRVEKEMIKQFEEQLAHCTSLLQKVKGRLKKIPEKLILSTQLELSNEVDKNVLRHLLQFIESKNLQNKLSTIEARPLDEAYCLSKPIRSSMLIFSIVGVGLGGILGMISILLLGLIKGLPISGANIRFKKYAYIGKISASLPKELAECTEVDLEILRSIALASSYPITALMQGHGPHYAHHIATLLGYQGKKVLLINLEQTMHNTPEEPGIYEYAEGVISSLPSKKMEQYEEIALGKKNIFITEFLRSKCFDKTLNKLQDNYDSILLVTRSPLISDEVVTCASYAESIILSYHDEIWEDVVKVRTLEKEKKLSIHFLEY